MRKGTGSSLSSGIVTALSTVVVSGAAAATGVVLAHEFGRTDATDGFFLAYAVYLVLTLAAYSFRVVVLPALTRAESGGRLREELAGQAAALAAVAVPAVVLAVVLSGALADALTSRPAARDAFAAALPWMVAAGALQLFAALWASALAARNSYGVAALGYAVGAVAGLGLFVALRSHGTVSLAWGLVLNGAVTAGVPLSRLGRDAVGAARAGLGGRLWLLVQGASFPVALQGLYTIANVFAIRLGTGEATELAYAYFFASFLVAVTASSLSLVSSAPLTRRGLTPEAAAAHVVHTSWLSLAPIVAGTGVFALVGGRIVSAVLGGDFSGGTAHDLGRLVVWFSPWMLVSIAVTLTFPLLFVLETPRVLVGLAIALPLLQVPLAWGLSSAFELSGLALSLALATGAALAVLLAALSRRALAAAAAGLGRVAAVEVALGALSFGVLAWLLGGIPAAAAGLLVYAALIPLAGPFGLGRAWAYVRSLH